MWDVLSHTPDFSRNDLLHRKGKEISITNISLPKGEIFS
ncbi:hypothetical protein LMxysn_2181 [Listeria monocytogenes]|nr:hypothetical protein LMxysn_2181 [Listeria monocytogenes]